MINSRKQRGNRGLSMIEVLLTVVLISVIGGVAFLVSGSVQERVDRTKLEQDIKVINSAAKLFVANGGSFDGLTQPQQILDRTPTLGEAWGQLHGTFLPHVSHR